MIQKMKKLSLLLYHKEKESFLDRLAELGVVHIEVDKDAESEQLTTIDQHLRKAGNVHRSLGLLARNEKVSLPQKSDKPAEQVIATFERLEQEKDATEAHILTMRKNISTLEPWGDFDPADVHRLEEVGVRTRFFIIAEKQFEKMPRDHLTMQVINRTEGTVFFVVMERGETVDVQAEPIVLPKISLTEANKKLKQLESERESIHKQLQELTAYTGVLAKDLAVANGSKDMENARLSMDSQVDGKIMAMTGWVPTNRVKAVGDFLKSFAAWHEFSEAEFDDPVPVALKNGKASRLMEPIIGLYSLPDYFEIDPTPFVTPFFVFFFGLCLGDLGYGAVLLLVSLIGMKVAPPKMRPFMALGAIMGLCTALAGLLLNTVFGFPVFATSAAENAMLSSGNAISLLSPVETARGTYFPAMPFSIYIGILQLILGMIIRIGNSFENGEWRDAVNPFYSIVIVLGVVIQMAKWDFVDMGKLELGAVAIGPWLTGIPASVVLALVFGGTAILAVDNLFIKNIKQVALRPVLIIWDAYNFASGLMSTGLSYLRLFALGLAGGLLGAAFNQIAFMIVTTPEGDVNYATPLIVFTVLILIFGHALNLVLSALGAFVHPLRLTFVEFFGGFSLGFKGGGKPYRPLAKVTGSSD